MNKNEKNVECATHGLCEEAFVCQHLSLTEPVGFIQAYDPDNPDEEILNAWCSECDKVLMEEGDWNDRSESFANIQLVCSECFGIMKKLNK